MEKTLEKVVWEIYSMAFSNNSAPPSGGGVSFIVHNQHIYLLALSAVKREGGLGFCGLSWISCWRVVNAARF